MEHDEEREVFFTELWETSPDPFWVCEPLADGDLRLLSFNRAQKTLLPSAEPGALYSRLLGSDFAEATKGYRECLSLKAHVEFDQRIRLDGRDCAFRTTLIPVLDPEGRVTRIWGTSRDLSDLVEARERAEKNARMLEQTVSERTAMLETAIRELARANAELSEANERYQRLAMHDSLTGLSNRRNFEEAGNREIARIRRYESDLSLVLFDMDDLKRLNDEFGHPVGDAAIRRVGEALVAECRSSDIAARIGGDEFALIMPETIKHEALTSAQRVLESLRAEGIEVAGRNVAVSISAGVVCAGPEDESFQDLYARADRALYRAKNSGKGKAEAE